MSPRLITYRTRMILYYKASDKRKINQSATELDMQTPLVNP